MNTLNEAMTALALADCLRTGDETAAAYDRLAETITADYSTKNPLILCVMIGGLIPTVEIIKRLDFPLELDYLHATRYRSGTDGGGLTWKRRPERELAGRHLLVIDDILDEGPTLAAIRADLAEASPATLRVAVLAQKRHDRLVPGAVAEYVGLDLPDRYVFGAGMDYKEFWRQLPGIYAVKA